MSGRRRHARPIEWPTVALAALIHGGWLLATFFWSALPLPLLMLAGGWFVAWHGSLQHEVMHGHPTRRRVVNDAFGSVPLSLWLPYAIYKKSHLRHHNDESLTDPIEDPESAYLTDAVWARLGPVARALVAFNNTILGRLLVGPFVMVFGFLLTEALAFARGDHRHAKAWALHLLACAGVLAWVILVCEMPLGIYLLAFVLTGASLSRIRSFAEHRWAERSEERTAIVEDAGPLALLFLHNNLHVLHHLRPAAPWYRLPAMYRAERGALIERNGGLVYRGYGDVFRRFLLRPHDAAVHPDWNG
ncbi:fatty acid desaturase [Aureimonas psammosilenae]|uniref:fatty acid desaturase n=1 Tax=Aureimonas psammosilenae TaxID=2495496 RepID=UPI0012604F26|nr:fatty acid desaturase [Aureimonas psammosilenae]